MKLAEIIYLCPDNGAVTPTGGVCPFCALEVTGYVPVDRDLLAENERLTGAAEALAEQKAALEWYADPMRSRAALIADGGVRARATLRRIATTGGQ